MQINWDDFNERADWLWRKFNGNDEGETDDLPLNRLAEKISEGKYIRKKISQQESYDYLKAYKRLVCPVRKVLFRKMIRIAAAIFLPVGIAVAIGWFISGKEEGKMAYSYSPVADIRPGEYKAYLQLNGGERLCLSRDTKVVYEKDGTKLKVDSAGLRYQQTDQTEEEEILYNTLIVPRGGEYFLTLGDGTKVWLNADSELEYPVSFGKKVREVHIRGEAYFEVRKAAEWPFIVKTEMGDIKVVGTAFNIRHYKGSDKMVTTLVKGKVACLLPGNEQIFLEPEQQLIAQKGRQAEIRQVDSRFHTGWKDGMFQFREERLEDIMDQLSRWYDIHVFYQCEPVKNLHFSGDLSRFKSITTFIEMFEKSGGVKMTLNGKILVIGF